MVGIERTKKEIANRELNAVSSGLDFAQHDLIRVYAVGMTFTKVSFKQAILSQCYFRKCRFVNCDFTGASFKECNLKGADFDSCIFYYCLWEKTQIDRQFLNKCLPSGENLARDVVRSLRVNFAQVGDYEAVNEAIRIEIRLTCAHFHNAAYSKLSYYRGKYKGWDRIASGVEHLKWKFLDLLWGNGESVVRVACVGLVVIVLFSIFHPEAVSVAGYFAAVPKVAESFWGVQVSPPLPTAWLAILTAIRFILFGMFMAILVKRLARR